VETQVLKSLTPIVRAKLPFKATSIIGETTDSSRNRIVVFEFLYGSPIDIARLASNAQLIASIGAAIGAIHNLDTELIRSAGLPEYSAADIARLRVNELDAVALTGKIPGVLLQRWQEALEDVALFRFNPTVVHGELSDSTVLEQDRNVSAVLNWGAMHIGDPAEDFAWLAGLRNVDLIEEARSAYSAETKNFDSTLIQRAMLYNELAHASWLLHGTKLGDESIVEEATINLEILEEEVNQGVAPSLSAAGFATLSQATGAFLSQEITTDSIVLEDPNQSLIENIDEIVILDDKTREIELPKKSDDELF
jgi:aminoglycoside phosphotransferase (APT) family kinase protein